MPARTDRIAVFPKYTTLVGGNDVYSVPIDVLMYGHAELVAWQGRGFGATPALVEFTVQESPDFEHWFDIGTLSPHTSDEDTLSATFHYQWIRVKATVTGSDPAVTCWLTGEFVTRERVAEGSGQ